LFKGPQIYKEPGLIGYWRFDEGSGCRVFDSSGNENHGILGPNCPNNSPLWVPIEEENDFSLEFDGEDDYIKILPKSNKPEDTKNNLLDITKDITIKVSLKYLANPKKFNGVIVAKYDRDFDLPYFLYSNAKSNELQFIIRDNFGREHEASFPFSKMEDWQSTWYNVVGTFNGENLKIFVNQKEGNSAQFTDFIRVSTGGLRIGARDAYDLGFKGIIDEVKIYNIAFEEIQSLSLK
jgi:hypothetical protein